MAEIIRAVHEHGQLRPLDPLALTDGQEIRLAILSEQEQVRSALADLLAPVKTEPADEMDEAALRRRTEPATWMRAQEGARSATIAAAMRSALDKGRSVLLTRRFPNRFCEERALPMGWQGATCFIGPAGQRRVNIGARRGIHRARILVHLRLCSAVRRLHRHIERLYHETNASASTYPCQKPSPDVLDRLYLLAQHTSDMTSEPIPCLTTKLLVVSSVRVVLHQAGRMPRVPKNSERQSSTKV